MQNLVTLDVSASYHHLLTVCVLGPDPNFEESPKRKSITYEELRNKNRESYEVTLTHKTDPSVRPMQERVPKKEGMPVV